MQDDHKEFLEDVEVRLIDKTQGSETTNQEYYRMGTLKTLYSGDLKNESDNDVPVCSSGNIWSLAMLIAFYLKVLQNYCVSCLL